VFVLSCVGSGLARGLITPSKELYQLSIKIHCSALILIGNRPEDLIRQDRRRWKRKRERRRKG
jgi:hypothetical protein